MVEMRVMPVVGALIEVLQKRLLNQTSLPATFEIPDVLHPLPPTHTEAKPALTTHFSSLFEETWDSLQKIFQKDEVPLFREIWFQLLSKNPEWVGRFVRVLELFQKANATETELVDLFRILKQIFPKTISPWDSPEILFDAKPVHHFLDVPTTANTQPIPDLSLENIRILGYLLEAQPNVPLTSRLSVGEVIAFFSQRLQENPKQIAAEIFSLIQAQKHGITPTDFQRLISHIDPVRLSLLLIEAEKKNAITSVVHELFTALKKDQPLAPLLRRWSNLLLSDFETRLSEVGRNDQVFFTQPDKVSMPRNHSVGLMMLALDSKEGIIPPENFEILAGSLEYAKRGMYLWFPAQISGKQKVRIKLKGRKSTKYDSIFNWMLDWNAEEMLEEAQEKDCSFYESQNQGPQTLMGTLDLNLSTPIFVQPFKGWDHPIPAPLQLSFHFLSQLIAPKHRFSTQDFLTFSRSFEVEQLQNSLRSIAKNGIAAFESYTEALQSVFNSLSKVMPETQISLDKARVYLRDQVLLYLMGKKQENSNYKMVEGATQGDLMASICSTVAGVEAVGGNIPNALVCMSDAIYWSSNKPYFKTVLDHFLKRLRLFLAGDSAAPWPGDLPCLPPGHFENTSKAELPLAESFLQHLKIKV